MKLPFYILINVFSSVFFISCNNKPDSEIKTGKSFEDFRSQHKMMHDSVYPGSHSANNRESSDTIYLCVNNCFKDSIYDAPGRCPVCNTELKAFETIRISKAEN